MRSTIINELKAIERDNGIKILYACESGSRGWQFPSPDSDYDVRFIYINSIDFYLSIQTQEDHLGFPINNALDIYGWDLKKVLKLLGKSNTTPFEWLQSPTIYGEHDEFRNGLWEFCQSYFDQKTNINHYLGIAKGALDTIVNTDEIKIKKLFYVLRSLLSAQWCLEKSSIAPMTIDSLITLIPEELQVLVKEMVKLKSTVAEAFIVKVNPMLMHYIEEVFKACYDGAKTLTKAKLDHEELDYFFRKTVRHYENQRTKG